MDAMCKKSNRCISCIKDVFNLQSAMSDLNETGSSNATVEDAMSDHPTGTWVTECAEPIGKNNECQNQNV